MAHHRSAYRPVGTLIVLGGGMAGLAAALSAAEAGAQVTLIEADTVPGGSARWSSGRIWSLDDYDALRASAPLGDASLQRVLVEDLEPALGWLDQSVGNLSIQPQKKSGRGRLMQLGQTGDRTPYFAAFAAAARSAGVSLQLGTRALSVARNRDDGFTITCDAGGAQSVKTASALVLATGGFQGDHEALMRFIGPEARNLMLRSNPHSSGAGLRMGLAMGGGTSRGMAYFYGKSMPPGADRADPRTYKSLTYDVARAAIAVNVDGHRFVDETAGISSENVANAGLMQPSAEYALLLDGSQQGDFDPLALSRHAAATGQEMTDLVLSADTINELSAAMAAGWGFVEQRLHHTITAFNAAATQGTTYALSPPRHGTHHGLALAPFTALRCRAAITIPLGGLKIDHTMRMGDTALKPVPGMFVAGADAGGVYPGAYAGGLGWALVSGRIAGLNAAGSLAE